MPQTIAHGYEFGPYRLDLAQRVLTRAGENVSLTPKATDILTLLVTSAGQLVAKDELLKHVWPDTFVEESNLTQNIFLLRRILGDDRPAPKYIETVVRRGYRFIANVRSTGAVDPVPNSQPTNGDHVPSPSVAVLPFLNITGNDDLEYLAEGLTENIVNNLSCVSKLRVMSRSAVFRYQKKELDPRVIGKELDVYAVLVGKITLRPSKSTGVSVELVEVASGWQLWGHSFDSAEQDILQIQDAITRQLLTALKLKLSGDEEKRVTARYTENAEAYQSYLEARYHWSHYTRAGIEKAILHFRQALELDPNYALAYAGIIDCYLRLTTNYLPPEEDIYIWSKEKARAKMRSTAKKRKKKSKRMIEDDDARVKLRFEWDWKGAERELRRANELKTAYPAAHQWYAAYQLAKKLFEQSKRSYQHEDLSKDCSLPNQVLSGEPTAAEQLQVLCAVAREQIAIANFTAAELILHPWYSERYWPNVSSLTAQATADLLFTLGTLLGCVGGSRQTPHGQKRAEAFLNGSIALFEHVGSKISSVEAQAELARCYYREGLFDLARDTFSNAISTLPDDQTEIKSLCLVFLGVVERDSGRLMDSLRTLREAISLQSPGRLGTGRCELELATTLKELAISESHQPYNEEARLHYATALQECEAIGNHRLAAVVENNLGFLLLNTGFPEESEQHLLRARRFFDVLSDSIRRAQVNETLTRLYLSTGRYLLAKQTIEDALLTLEMTDAEALLSEALTTNGIVSSRLGHFSQAQQRFEEAYKVAERCRDREGARRALVSKFDEIGHQLSGSELHEMLEKLKHLQLINEPTPLAHRVIKTTSQIEELVNGNRKT